MSRRRRGADWTTTDIICHWCHGPAGGSPYRTPVDGVPAVRWVVCSPDCTGRPEGRPVFAGRTPAR